MGRTLDKWLRLAYWLSPVLLFLLLIALMIVVFNPHRFPAELAQWCIAWWWTVFLIAALFNALVRWVIRALLSFPAK